MLKAARLLLALCALAATAAVAAGCGGVPGNAVAEVDGTAIPKEDFEHWMAVVAKSSGQPNASVPDAPEYTKCVENKRKTAPKPAKGQPKTTDQQLKEQCKQEYEQIRDQVLQLLTSFAWIEGEAEEMGIKVSDAEIKKSFEQQKKQSFPKEADYQKFLKDYGQTEDDVMQRVKLDVLSNKIRDKVIKGKDKVTDAQIEDFYNKNKERFAQPERRDLRIALTKGEEKANQAKAALEDGQSWKDVAKQYSIDEASKSQAGKLPAQAEGTLEKALDEAVFKAKKGEVYGPVEDAVRLLRVRGGQGPEGLAADARAGQGDDPPDAPVAEPAEGARQVRRRLPEEVEGAHGVPRGLRDAAVQERAEADADAEPDRARAAGSADPADPAEPAGARSA